MSFRERWFCMASQRLRNLTWAERDTSLVLGGYLRNLMQALGMVGIRNSQLLVVWRRVAFTFLIALRSWEIFPGWHGGGNTAEKQCIWAYGWVERHSPSVSWFGQRFLHI
jgi:hypothetical protein